jgi:CubicO group peptidase (beta-lactamase class C family)
VRAGVHESGEKNRTLPVTKGEIIGLNWHYHKPSGDYDYANFNYLLAGRLIEQFVPGRSYQEFVDSEILQPRGLTSFQPASSDYRAMVLPNEAFYFDATQRRFTVGPPDQKPSVRNPDRHDVDWPYGGYNIENMDSHGGWVASAADLVRFTDALFLSESIVNKDCVKAITDRKNAAQTNKKDEPPSFYGLGWGFQTDGPDGTGNVLHRYHAGSLPGSVSILHHQSVKIGEVTKMVTWAALANIRMRYTGGGENDVTLNAVSEGMAKAVGALIL